MHYLYNQLMERYMMDNPTIVPSLNQLKKQSELSSQQQDKYIFGLNIMSYNQLQLNKIEIRALLISDQWFKARIQQMIFYRKLSMKQLSQEEIKKQKSFKYNSDINYRELIDQRQKRKNQNNGIISKVKKCFSNYSSLFSKYTVQNEKNKSLEEQEKKSLIIQQNESNNERQQSQNFVFSSKND